MSGDAFEDRLDAARRNSGRPTLTVWKDGSYQIWGFRDAEVATLSEPETVLFNLDAETFMPVDFITPEQRVALANKLFARKPQS